LPIEDFLTVSCGAFRVNLFTPFKVIGRGLRVQQAVAGLAPPNPLTNRLFGSVWMMTAFGMAFVIALVWPKLTQIWMTGVFDDPDDAMRLVQVRAWLSGQNWYDLTAHRLDPPAGVFMHWSRVIDVPLAALVLSFKGLLPTEAAERLARIIDPLLLMACLLATMAYAAREFIGPRAIGPTIVLIVGSGIVFGQFAPGSIHHHATQIALLAAIMATTLRALDPRFAKGALFAGLLIALSLSIGLENLHYIVVLAAVYPLNWTFGGDEDGIALGHFAMGLAAGLGIMFVATVGPTHYFIGACDAFSMAHLTAGLGACGVFVLLRHRSSLTRWPARLGLSAIGGGAVISVVALTFPACLGDPLAQIDAFTRDVWLSNIQEARPLLSVLSQWPSLFPMLVLPFLLGTFLSVAAAVHEKGITRIRWLVLVGLLLAGWAAAMWQIRALAAVTVLSTLGPAWFANLLARRSSPVLPFALSLPFCAIAWALLVPPAGNPVQQKKASGTQACQEPDNFMPMNELPPGLIFAPVNSGSHLLVHTRHSVLAAPYHRDTIGNRRVIGAFLASPEAAYKLVADSGATYFAYCPSLPQMRVFADRAPQGLAAALLEGRIPDWLQRIDLGGSQYQIFTIRKPVAAAL
jgi:hypothetical protein